MKPGMLLLIGLFGSLASATEPAPKFQPLRPLNACLDPARARAFRVFDSRNLLVDAGRRHYRIELGWRCPALLTAQELVFDSRNPGGRICGDLGDVVYAAGRAPRELNRCPIAKIIPLSADEAAAELRLQSRKAEPSASETPSAELSER